MDDLVDLLTDHALEHAWTLEHTSVVIAVKAVSNEACASPGDAFLSAQTLLQVLLGAGYRPITRADVGASCDAFEDEGVWRGKIDVVLTASDSTVEAPPVVGMT